MKKLNPILEYCNSKSKFGNLDNVNWYFAGIYRVNYDTHNWEMLASALKRDHNSIHHLNRAQVSYTHSPFQFIFYYQCSTIVTF